MTDAASKAAEIAEKYYAAWSEKGYSNAADSLESMIAAAIESAVQAEKDSTATWCAFCSFEVPRPATLESIQNHVINECQEHPLRKMLQAERARAAKLVDAAKAAIPELCGREDVHDDPHEQYTRNKMRSWHVDGYDNGRTSQPPCSSNAIRAALQAYEAPHEL